MQVIVVCGLFAFILSLVYMKFWKKGHWMQNKQIKTDEHLYLAPNDVNA